jgi:hypothetical protein
MQGRRGRRERGADLGRQADDRTQVRVHGRGADSDRYGPRSNAAAAVTVGAPAPPTKVRAVRTAARTLRVTYRLGANNGAAIRSKTATCRPKSGGAQRSVTQNGKEPAPIAVAGLTAGKRYTCTVAVRNARGPSGPSKASNGVKV